MLTRPEERLSSPAGAPIEDAELRAATQRQLKRARRLRMNFAAWGVGTIVLTAGWIVYEWHANGAFARFGHEGNPGDWNPTLWALVVLVWGLMVGITALRAYFERPATATEVDREVERLQHAIADDGPAGVALRRVARARLERVSRLRFQVAAWGLGMIVLTPVNVLIEWQDNGGFERLSRNSRPGSWDPWVLAVGGIWALVVVIVYALPVYLERRKEGNDGTV